MLGKRPFGTIGSAIFVATIMFTFTVSSERALAQSGGSVVINGKPVSQQTLQRLGVPIQPGQYWYDAKCGAWGQQGGSTQGFIQAGLALPGPLRADASNGTSGVFINGRQATNQDVQALRQHHGRAISPGRYSVDSSGILQPVGGARAAAPKRTSKVAPQQVQKGGGRHFIPGWNMSCQLPNGWQARGEKNRTYLLVNSTGTGTILVHRTMANNVSIVEQGLAALAQSARIRITDPKRMKTRRKGGQTVAEQTYSAMDGYGRQYKLKVGAILSGHGTALVVLGGSTPESFASVKKAVQKIMSSAQLGAPQYNTRALVGTYSSYSGSSTGSVREGSTMVSTESFYTFDGMGRFRTNTNSMVSADTGTHNTSGEQEISTGSASLIDGSKGHGTYKLIGKDTLILTRNGRTSVHSIQIFGNGVEVDGNLFAKK